MNAALLSLLARAAFRNFDYPTSSIYYHRVGMMHECGISKLLAREAFLEHDEKCKMH